MTKQTTAVHSRKPLHLIGGCARPLGGRQVTLALFDLLERLVRRVLVLRLLVLHPRVEYRAEQDGPNGRGAAAANSSLVSAAGGCAREGDSTYVLMMSWKSQTPSIDAATPRTADETMCVIGEVTLMESRLAMLIRKPKTPCKTIL